MNTLLFLSFIFFALSILFLIVKKNISPTPPKKKRSSQSSKNEKSGSSYKQSSGSVKLKQDERKMLLEGVRNLAAEDPKKSAELLRHWIEGDEKSGRLK